MALDLSKVTPVSQMAGDDAEETALLRAELDKARAYLHSQKWCRGIKEAFFGSGIAKVVCTFLFRIDPDPGVDEWLWVVVGDVPSAYMVPDDIVDGVDAIAAYCELMDEWVRAVRGQGSLKDVFPVRAPPTSANAAALESRIGRFRNDIIPTLLNNARA